MGKLESQVKRHNASMQQMKRFHTYNSRFIIESTGNLVVTGGNKQSRRQVLLSQIEFYRLSSNDSVFIFSNDSTLKMQLIEKANAGTIGELYVIDSRYANYDFFTDLPLNLIAEYFSKVAIQRGCRDTSKLLSYTDAFLNILSSEETVSLLSIKKMLNNDDAYLASIAKSEWDRDCIISSLEGGSLFRDLVSATIRAFSPITSRSSGRSVSLLSKIDQDCVVFIDTPLINNELFAIYFAIELLGIMNLSFKVFLDDNLMMNNNEMRNTMQMVKQRQAEVVLSYENIVSVNSPQYDILDNIERRIIFLNGKMPAVDLQTVFSRYGQYTAFKSMDHRDSPPAYLFTFLHGKGEAPLPYQRDRVLLQELKGMEAVLSKGSSAEIIVAKKLCFDKEK